MMNAIWDMPIPARTATSADGSVETAIMTTTKVDGGDAMTIEP